MALINVDLSEIEQEADTYNDTDAMLQLGKSYQDGSCVKKDMGKASYWFKRAAELGCGESQYRYSLLIRANPHVTDREVKADEWLARSVMNAYQHEEQPNYLVEIIVTIVGMGMLTIGLQWLYGIYQTLSVINW